MAKLMLCAFAILVMISIVTAADYSLCCKDSTGNAIESSQCCPSCNTSIVTTEVSCCARSTSPTDPSAGYIFVDPTNNELCPRSTTVECKPHQCPVKYDWYCTSPNGTAVPCCEINCGDVSSVSKSCVQIETNPSTNTSTVTVLSNPSQCEGVIPPTQCPDCVPTPEWRCPKGNSFSNDAKSCCEGTCFSEEEYQSQLVCVIDGQIAAPEDCAGINKPRCDRRQFPNPPSCTSTYTVMCTEAMTTTGTPVYHECSCKNFKPCYSGLITQQCVHIDGDTITPVPASNCPNMQPDSKPLDCSCSGSWWCSYNAGESLIWGACDCDRFENKQWVYNNDQAISTNLELDDIVHPCDENDAFSLSFGCFVWNANGTVQQVEGNQCPPLDQDQLRCKCDDTQVDYEWTCSVVIGTTTIVAPCSDMCKKIQGSDFASIMCRGYKFNPVCVVQGTSQIVSNTNCAGQTAPTTPVCNVDTTKCPHHWECSISIGITTQTIPCDSIDYPLCASIREKFPCDDGKISSTCVNSLTGQATTNVALCGSTNPVTSPTLSSICPPSRNCEGSNQYHWGCTGTGFNTTSNTSFTVPTSTVTFTDDAGNQYCRCTALCDGGYKLFAQCYDQNNAVVNNNLCDPATNPAPTGAYCPQAPAEKCRDTDVPTPCERICSIKFDSNIIYFPCEEYEKYCYRFSNTWCGGDFHIEALCGSVTATGVFVPSKDECCKDQPMPWPMNNNVYSTTYDCDKNSTVAQPEKFEQLSIDVLSRLPAGTPCKHEWRCKKVDSNGSIIWGECDCSFLQEWTKEEDGTVSVNSCGFELEPVCVSYSYNSPNGIAVDDSECAGYTAPTGDLQCPCPENDKKFEWFCANTALSPLSYTSCSSACSTIALENELCSPFRISAQCFETYPTYQQTPNSNCYGSPFPSTTSTSTVQSCPGLPQDSPLCSNDESYFWKCYLAGHWDLGAVPCHCDKLPKWYYEKFGCKFDLISLCYNANTGTVVADQTCAQFGLVDPLTSPNTAICNNCEEPRKVELKCYRNGDLTLPTPCDSKCVIRGDCTEYTIQAQCQIVGNPSATVPLSQCGTEWANLSSNTSLGFTAQGIRNCRSEKWNKYCNLKFVCRAHIDNNTFDYDCSSDNYCSLLANSASSKCRQAKVENICINFDASMPSNQNSWTQVSPNACLSAGLIAPLGGSTNTAACPNTLPSGCFTDVSYDWLCVDGSANGDFDFTAPYICKKPTCDGRRSLYSKPCRDYYVTAQCYQITTPALGSTTPPTYTLVSPDYCPWSNWPVSQPNDPTSFVSLYCPCKEPCTNGAINPPRCNIFKIDEPVIWDGGIDWNINGDSDDNSTNPCLGPIMIAIESSNFRFKSLQKETASGSDSTVRFTNGIDTRSLIGTPTELTAQATLLTPCGDFTAPSIPVKPWCLNKKCNSPRICDEVSRDCICPKGTTGSDCTKCNPDQVFNDLTLTCTCPEGTVLDEVKQTCVKKCPHKVEPNPCPEGSTWSRVNCSCQCPSGTTGEKCQCFENFFDITFNKRPENIDEFVRLWATLAEEYLGFDLQLPTGTDLKVIKVREVDGKFVVTFRLQTCDEKVLAYFRKVYETFVNSQKQKQSMLTLADDQVVLSNHFLQSDVVSAAAGFNQASNLYTEAQEMNSSAIIGAMIAFVAVIFAVVF